MKRIAVVISVLVFFGMSQGIGMEKDAMVRKMKENLLNLGLSKKYASMVESGYE